MISRTQHRGSVWLTADRLVAGNQIIPPGRTRPVEIVGQLSDPGSADYFEFACLSRQGTSAVRLHRSEKVEVLRKEQSTPPATPSPEEGAVNDTSKAENGAIADDLFAGAGGWDLAASQLGIHARGVEIMPEARATREAVGLTTIHDDVWTFEPDGAATGLIASPPCQTFSVAGKGTGRKALDDVLGAIWSGAYRDIQALRDVGEKVKEDRTALVLTPLHFATVGGYRWLAWEQVPAVLPVWQACAEVLDELGWNTWTGYLHAEQYGVPQTRKRAFLLASLDGNVLPPAATHSHYYSNSPTKLDPGVRKWVSMAEALGWGLQERPSPTVTGGGTETGGAEPNAKIVERWTTRPDWCFRSPAPVIAADPRVAPRGCKHPQPGCCSKYPGTPGLQFGPGTVRLEPHEAGILQSFPADYPWQGNRGKQFLQAGNAIPPGLALPALRSATTAVELDESDVLFSLEGVAS